MWLPAMVACAQVAGLEEVELRPGVGGASAGGVTATGTSSTGAGGTVTGAGGGGGCASDYAAEVMADQPVWYWRLGESAAAAARDEVGLNDGTCIGMPTVGEPGALACDDDTVVRLDGGDQYINFDDIFEFSGTASFFVEVWMKADIVDSDDRYIVSHRKDPRTTPAVGWGLYIVDQHLDFRRWFADSSRDVANVPIDQIALDRYIHIVATYDGSNMRLYVDGLLVAEASSIDAIDTTDAHLLAGRPYVDATQDHFAGLIDEIAIYDVALDATRVRAHHDAGIGQ
jgi:hypothetical protein